MRFDIYINRSNSNQDVMIAVGVDMPTVVKMTQLDPNEVAWAVEEEGKCETEYFTVVEACDDCVENGLIDMRLPNSLLEDMEYVLFIDQFVQQIMSRTKTKDEFIATLNLFGIQVQRVHGYKLHPNDRNANGDTIQ